MKLLSLREISEVKEKEVGAEKWIVREEEDLERLRMKLLVYGGKILIDREGVLVYRVLDTVHFVKQMGDQRVLIERFPLRCELRELEVIGDGLKEISSAKIQRLVVDKMLSGYCHGGFVSNNEIGEMRVREWRYENQMIIEKWNYIKGKGLYREKAKPSEIDLDIDWVYENSIENLVIDKMVVSGIGNIFRDGEIGNLEIGRLEVTGSLSELGVLRIGKNTKIRKMEIGETDIEDKSVIEKWKGVWVKR